MEVRPIRPQVILGLILLAITGGFLAGLFVVLLRGPDVQAKWMLMTAIITAIASNLDRLAQIVLRLIDLESQDDDGGASP